MITKIHNKQIEGLMFHEGMLNAFDFLRLKGFYQWQVHQYLDESKEMIAICHRYLQCTKKLLPHSEGDIKVDVSPIPEAWKTKTAADIDRTSISEAVRVLLKKYAAWEKGVIELYAACAKEALENEDYETFIYLKELVFDVKKELGYVEDLQIELESVDYDTQYIKRIQERFLIEWA